MELIAVVGLVVAILGLLFTFGSFLIALIRLLKDENNKS
ncbi:putative holin-like toxin [Brevibacillus formosus]